MIDPRPVVAIACSGGRDSVALLHATLNAGRALGTSVVALHVHHGLMADADRWASELEALCECWNVGFECERLSGSPEPGESVEAWARRGRYRALARMARDAGASLVLLGHHLHDQAETVLLQALRGAGPAGLAAMPRVVERDVPALAQGLQLGGPAVGVGHQAVVHVQRDDTQPELARRGQRRMQQRDRIASAAAGNRNDGAITHGLNGPSCPRSGRRPSGAPGGVPAVPSASGRPPGAARRRARA